MKTAHAERWTVAETRAHARELLAQSAATLETGRCAEGVHLSRQALTTAVDLRDRSLEAAALGLLARQQSRLGENEQAATVCERAAVILREQGDRAGLCEILIIQALALNTLGLSEEALEALNSAHEVAVGLGNRTLLYWVLNRIAVVHGRMREHARAHDVHARALAMSEGLDDDARFCILNNVADNAIGLAEQQSEDGEETAAAQTVVDGLAYARQALDLATSTNNPYRRALALDNLGVLLAQQGHLAAARERLESSLWLSRRHGYRSMAASARFHLARLLVRAERPQQAIGELESVLAEATATGNRPLQLEVLLTLSEALEESGRFRAALARHKEYVALERRLRSGVAATRARMLSRLVDVENARLEAATARSESLAHRARSRELENEKRALEVHARTLEVHAKTLARLAREDALTGVSNRHHLESELPRLHAEATSQGADLAVVVLDIDHFKQVNDTFGHAVGDAVLSQVATLVARHRRSGDLVGRLGGEEFLLALPGLDEATAARLCQRLRADIEQYDWSAIRPGLRLTASLGVAGRAGETDVDDLLERADAAMYRAKRSGRNRVERHGDR